jgi:hypothetical protein
VPSSQIARVTIPDVHGLSEQESQDRLRKARSQALKIDQCKGSDQGDTKRKNHRIECQNTAAKAAIPLGTTVEYVLR